MRYDRVVNALLLLASLALAADPPDPPTPEPIAADRVLQKLPEGDARAQLAAAAEGLGDWSVALAGVAVDGPFLARLAATPASEPLLRATREQFRQPVDLDDLILFLDDVLVAGESGRRGEPFVVPSGRARAAGILVHPDDVFRDRPRVYGERYTQTAVDAPQPPDEHEPATDGDPPGPGWTARFTNPSTPPTMIAALADERPDSGFASRVAALTWQLAWQGADVWLTSTVRDRTRGYLMWGAFVLSRAKDADEAESIAAMLDDRNSAWGLDAPITWRHPDGWQATVEGARQMADAYDVVYATEGGARNSNHYGGVAADLVAVGLPRTLHLVAPDGAERTFDLSGPDQPRDLSITPELVDWIEAHFGMRKLRSDYPHWSDAG